jgi:hypothetical protein
MRIVRMWAMAATLVLAGAAVADEAKSDKPAEGGESKPARFRPPSRGAPESRIGGGVRAGAGDVVFVAMVPRQIALTVSARPTLQWYLGGDVAAPLQLSVTRLDNYETIYEVELPDAGKAGIGSHQLDEAARLEPKVQYEWTITLVTNEDNPSLNPVSGGWLQLVEESDDLKAAVKDKSPADKVLAYAERGVWYDAIRVLNEAIAAQPDQEALVALRQALLNDENVGLKDVAEGLAGR